MSNLKFNEKNPINFKDFSWNKFLPQLDKAYKQCEKRLERITNSPASFENTILGLEDCNQEFAIIESIFHSLTGVNKDPKQISKIDKLSEKINKLSNNLSGKIIYNQEIFKKVKEVYLKKAQFKGEDLQLLNKTYEMFVDSGIHLPKIKQTRLLAINESMGKIGIKIESNLQKEPQNYFIKAIDSEVLGLPEDCLALGRELAKKKKFKGYIFAVDEANYTTFLDYAQNQRLRTEMTQKFKSLGSNHNPYNNFKLIKELLKLRKEQASILGYKNYAELILKDRMVKKEKDIHSFLDNIEKKVRPLAAKETFLYKNLAKADGLKNLTVADESYYNQKIKSQNSQVNLNELRDFFPLDHVWKGLQELIYKLYGVKFVKANIPTYHNSVDAYFVKESGKTLGVLYMDWFSRPEKEAGAWMNPIVEPSNNQIPFVLVANNFIRPSKNQKTCLSLYDVKTLFHEMGHALHVLFSKTKYESLGGINVAWDFVELPSQFMENFVCQPKVMKMISCHYKTKKSLDNETIKKVTKMDKMFNASSVLAFVGLGKLDLLLHSQNPKSINFSQLDKFYQRYRTLPLVPKTSRISNFSHILDGGYAVGYYSYQWAEMLDSNCFEVFEREGIFSKKIAKRFRENLLSKGGTEDAMNLLKNFTKKEPSVAPFLKKHGLK